MPPGRRCICHCQTMNDESGEHLPWTQNSCTTKVSSIHDITRNVHRSSRPVINLLQCIEAREFMQNVVLVSQVVQPLTTPVTLFAVENNGAKEPRRRSLCGGRAPFDVTHPTRESEQPVVPPAVQAPETCQSSVLSFHLW